MRPVVSVIIPTLGRPAWAERAARSALAQDIDAPFEVVLVDNDPAHSARGLSDRLKAEAGSRVVTVHEPRLGVATARNAGWAGARASLIAFLDDDEVAPPHWLSALLATHAASGAGVVWGPIDGCAPEGRHKTFLDRFWSRPGPDQDGPAERHWGCGNALLDRAGLGLVDPPFSTDANETGGEDDRLFEALRRRGDVAFWWSAAARVVEHVPAHRASLAFALRKAFAYGQGPSQKCAQGSPPNPLGVIGWMGVGAGQAALYGLGAAALWPMAGMARYDLLATAVSGLGKVLWMDRFAPRFYGAAAQPSPVVASPSPAASSSGA